MWNFSWGFFPLGCLEKFHLTMKTMMDIFLNIFTRETLEKAGGESCAIILWRDFILPSVVMRGWSWKLSEWIRILWRSFSFLEIRVHLNNLRLPTCQQGFFKLFLANFFHSVSTRMFRSEQPKSNNATKRIHIF